MPPCLRRHLGWLLVILGLSLMAVGLSVVTAWAAETTVPMTNLAALLIPLVVPALVAGLKWAVPRFPRRVLPLVAIGLGALADTALYLASGSSLGPLWGAVLGAAGTGVREAIDQIKQGVTA